MRFILLSFVFGIGVTAHKDVGATEAFHFAYEISPLLVKKGCASAECHGSATGQGGFKLSLFGMDPAADHAAITLDLGGRRVDFAVPGLSLVLQKPTRQISHKGGRVIRKDGHSHRRLLDWIRAGAPFASENPGQLDHLRLTREGMNFHALAVFKNDNQSVERDVTSLTVFSSSDETVALVDDDGQVDLMGPGRAWIMARFGGLNALAPLRQRFSNRGGPTEAGVKYSHPLDRAWLESLRALGLQSAPRADDFTLARRIHLDLAGRPPAPEELEAFFALPESERLTGTADRLLKGWEFNAVFAGHLRQWFEVPEAVEDKDFQKQRHSALRRFFLNAVRDRKPLATIAGEIVSEGSANQLVSRFGDPRDRAEYVSRTLLGMSIGCARCHDHPLDKWKQREHLAFSALFTDPRPKPDGDGMMAGEMFLPGSGLRVQPVLLPLKKNQPDPETGSRHEKLARFLESAGSDQFARNAANRIFGILIGRHLVEPPDDHRLSNPAVHEAMLDTLISEFKSTRGDLRAMARFIVTSHVYAADSNPADPENLATDPAASYLARREARPMQPTQFKQAVEFVLGVALDNDPPPESPLARQLYMLNSSLIRDGLATPGNQVSAIADFVPDTRRRLSQLYRLALSRDPRPDEEAALLPALEGPVSERDGALRDLAFALMAGREFGSLR